MSQFSIHLKYCTSCTQVESLTPKIATQLPAGGKVNILTITDKQYERIESLVSRVTVELKNPADQYDLI